MKHLDLFSGIGGFAYAVDQVWDNAEHIFCDNDKFCQQVIKKHWPNSKIYEDIRLITDTNWDGLQEPRAEQQASGDRQFHQTITDTESGQSGKSPEQKRWKDFSGGGCDILTGGFPCQPFSQAGRRRGTDDNRYLWPEMLRVIQLTKPTWVIAENVRGLLTINEGLVFEQVCLDLEASGYEVQPFIIPAVSVNAPHRRDRVWFVAHRTGGRKWGSQPERDRAGESEAETGNRDRDASDTQSGESGESSKSQGWENFSGRNWETNWLEVATELCGVDDGLPTGLDYAGWTKAGHRVQRLKALGNAIVPQVAIEIMKGIKMSDT